MRITPTHVYFFTFKDVFSNWHKSDFEVNGVKFNCMEQYMMYSKAKFFGDEKVAAEIMLLTDPKDHKAKGRDVTPYNDDAWNAARDKIVIAGLLRKFSQNEHLLKALLDTGTRRLVEASPYDKLWGCGLKESDPRILDENNWPGLNKLGNCLEVAREVLEKRLENKNTVKTEPEIVEKDKKRNRYRP